MRDKVGDEIRRITDRKVLDFMKTNPNEKDLGIFKAKAEQVKIGMVYVRDREIMKRVSSGQQIRVFSLVSMDKAELKKYVEMSMPQMITNV